MPKSKVNFSSSVKEETKKEVCSEIEEAFGDRTLKSSSHVFYYQDAKIDQPTDAIVYFDKDPVPKDVNLNQYSRMVFSSEPNHLAHEIALSHYCGEDQEIKPELFFTTKVILRKQFSLNTFKELGLIETYLEENFADQISFKSMVSAALDELVRNSFDQLVKEEVKTSVLVEIIIAECGQWGIKIKDFVGTLDYVNLQKNFSVYKNEKVQIDRQTMGAGVGLGLVMSLAHRLYVIVKKNVSTEIFFIYDPKLKVKRSFQYFEL